MSPGHSEAQLYFERLGKAYGLKARRTWTAAHPTDGVWTLPAQSGQFSPLPFAALEVIVSESPKTARGSVHTLEVVSPALAVIVIQEEEIRRSLISSGRSADEALRRLCSLRGQVTDLTRMCRQRFEVWSFAELREIHAVATGHARFYAAVGQHS